MVYIAGTKTLFDSKEKSTRDAIENIPFIKTSRYGTKFSSRQGIDDTFTESVQDHGSTRDFNKAKDWASYLAQYNGCKGYCYVTPHQFMISREEIVSIATKDLNGWELRKRFMTATDFTVLLLKSYFDVGLSRKFKVLSLGSENVMWRTKRIVQPFLIDFTTLKILISNRKLLQRFIPMEILMWLYTTTTISFIPNHMIIQY